MVRILVAVLFIIVLPRVLLAADFTGQVVGISDGDTKLAFGKEVTVQIFGHDKYGRTLGDVRLPDGAVLNRELVTAGLAWWYEKYSNDVALRDLQEEARRAKRGLWIYPDPVAPSEWRHRMNPTLNGSAKGY